MVTPTSIDNSSDSLLLTLRMTEIYENCTGELGCTIQLESLQHRDSLFKCTYKEKNETRSTSQGTAM